MATQGKKRAGVAKEPLRIRIVCKDGLTTGIRIEDADTGREILASRLELAPIVAGKMAPLVVRLDVMVQELDLTVTDSTAVLADIAWLQGQLESAKYRFNRFSPAKTELPAK